MDQIQENRSLTAMQRRRRSVNLKRRHRKIEQQRMRKRHRMAGKPQLQRRAAAAAKALLRDRVAGKGKGKGYTKLSTSEKIVIDNIVNKPEYKKRLKRLAKFLMGFIRRGEMTRLQDVNKNRKTVKYTGGVGRLYADYQHDNASEVISEAMFDERLKRLLLAGLDKKQDVQLYQRLLGNTKNYAKMSQYREKILNFLDNLVDMVLKDTQLFHRAELVARKEGLDEDMLFENKYKNIKTREGVDTSKVAKNRKKTIVQMKDESKKQAAKGHRAQTRLQGELHQKHLEQQAADMRDKALLKLQRTEGTPENLAKKFLDAMDEHGDKFENHHHIKKVIKNIQNALRDAPFADAPPAISSYDTHPTEYHSTSISKEQEHRDNLRNVHAQAVRHFSDHVIHLIHHSKIPAKKLYQHVKKDRNISFHHRTLSAIQKVAELEGDKKTAKAVEYDLKNKTGGFRKGWFGTRKENPDLQRAIFEEKEYGPLEVGTQELVDTYAAMTPGQEKVLRTVKKLVKENLLGRGRQTSRPFFNSRRKKRPKHGLNAAYHNKHVNKKKFNLEKSVQSAISTGSQLKTDARKNEFKTQRTLFNRSRKRR